MCAASALLWWCLYSLYQRQSRCLRAADFNIATQTRPLQLESFDMCLYLFSWMCVLPAPPQPHPETREQCWQVIRLLTRSAFREFRQPDWLKPRHTIKPSLGNGEKKSIFDGFVFFLSDLLKKKKKDIQGASTSTPGHRGIAGVTVSTFRVASPPQCLEQQGDVHLLCVPFVQG